VFGGGPVGHGADAAPIAGGTGPQDVQFPNRAIEVRPQFRGDGSGYHSGVYLLDGQPLSGFLAGVNCVCRVFQMRLTIQALLGHQVIHQANTQESDIRL